jgi:hypothetical protein
VIRSLPRWELMREQPPCAATAHDIENGVQDLADRVQARSAKSLGRR